MPHAHSFDVFDTCLVRDHASGFDVVAEAARRLAPAGPDLDVVVGEAVRLRVEGERRACRDGRDASLLPEIYAAVPELRSLGIDPDAMCALEVELERQTLRPVAPVAARISALRAAGERVLFISDMHLPAEVIRGALTAHGIASPDDPVYVSGEVGRSKLTGRLFDHVLRQEGLRPDAVTHTGDDPHTDGVMAASRGLAVTPFERGRLSRYEEHTLRRAPAPHRDRSRSAGTSRLARLGEISEADVDVLAATVGADVVGPLFTGFVRWALDDARARGVETLCFVARDGQVLHEIAQRIRRPDDPRCLYLYGSRQAWFLPAVRSASADELAWVFEPKHERATVRSLLAKLDLTPERVAAELADCALAADDEVALGEPGAVVELLEKARPVIAERAAAARELLRRYVDAEGLLDGRPWAVVDIGWYLNAQAALRTALGPEVPLGGYYLGLREGRRPLAEAGWFRAVVREDHPGGRRVLPGGWLLDNLNVVEHVFAKADHGGCRGYEERDGRVVPRLGPDPVLPAWFAPLRAALLRYASAAAAAGLLDEGGEAVLAVGLEAGRLFAEDPTRDEALLFGATRVSDDQTEARLRALAPPLTVDDLRWRVARRLRGGPDDPARWKHWEAGTWAATSPALRSALTVGRAAAPRLRQTLRAARGGRR